MIAPTGFGKTATAVVIASLVGGRACYAVETKPLQKLIEREFGSLVYDIRGKGNYDCALLNEQGIYGAQGKCDRAEGLCESCSLKERGCSYFDRHRAASRHALPLTNYSYWLAINEYNEQGLGKFDCLILDECHSAPDHLSKSLRVELSGQLLDQFGVRLLPASKPIREWASWAAQLGARFAPRIESLRSRAQIGGLRGEQHRELRQLQGLVLGLSRLSQAGDDWIEDRATANSTAFEPIWPARYGEKLFRGIQKVVMMSATTNVKNAELLGIKPDEIELLEFPSSFPVERRPVIYVKTVQMRAGMSDAHKIEMVRRIDQAQDRRMDRNGIIHTVSYERMRHFLEHTRHRDKMMSSSPGGDTEALIERYKERKNSPPWDLVGPSFGTGHSFPGAECEWQAIMKIPFPDTRNPIIKARIAADPNYRLAVAAIALMQYCGRPMRFVMDRCQSLIFDDNWNWCRWEMRKLGLLTQWFDQACIGPVSLPEPLPKL